MIASACREVDDLRAQLKLADEVIADMIRTIDRLKGALTAIENDRDTWRARAE